MTLPRVLPASPSPGATRTASKWFSVLPNGLSFRPGLHRLSRLIGKPEHDFLTRARERSVLAPPSLLEVRPAKMLPGQVYRIRGTKFGTPAEVVRDFTGGFASLVPATYAYHFRNVHLIDGVLYTRHAAWHLRKRASYRPVYGQLPEVARASFYESWTGNRWFGNWLGEDCLTYPLAEQFGSPTRIMDAQGHKEEYHSRLGINAKYVTSAAIDELVMFDDHAHNAGKRARGVAMRNRLLGEEPAQHPGVFILRGTAGDRRVLRNERTIAEYLASRRGFRILDPLRSTVDEIIDACGGARVVAGVEGSQLVHGLMVMPPDAMALVIQPPTRAVSVLKLWTDRQGQDFGVVIGDGTSEAFYADPEEIERTLDLA